MSEFWGSFWEGFAEGLGLFFRPIGRFLWPYCTFANFRNLAGWGIYVYCAQFLLWNVWVTNGEATCDFAGQWLMGRMFAAGRADELYIVGPERHEFALGYASGPEPAKAALRRCAREQPELARGILTHPHPEQPLLDLAKEDPQRFGALLDADGKLALDFADHKTMVQDILRKGMDVTPTQPEPQLQLAAALPFWTSLPHLPALAPPVRLLEMALQQRHLRARRGDPAAAPPNGLDGAPISALTPWDPLVEGALYPPTAGLLFAPLGFMAPKAGHRCLAVFYVLSVAPIGFFLSRCTQKRLQWGEAAAGVINFPNFLQAMLLGQNSLLTLLIVSGGWFCYTKKRPLLAGLVWGFLAYKPVFAVGLLLVPLALPSWRLIVGMGIGGGAFVLATLPFVGVQGLDRLVTQNDHARKLLKIETPLEPIDPANWRDTNAWERWLLVGKHAAHMYTYDTNWIWMSRDLACLPFRKLWTAEELKTQGHYLYQRYFRGVDTYNAHKEGYVTTLEYQRQSLQGVNLDDETKSLDKLSLMLIAFVAGVTLLVGWDAGLVGWVGGYAPDGIFATDRHAFLLTGGLLSVYHFMHYDVLLFTLPVALCLGQLTRYGWGGRIWILFILAGFFFCYWDLWQPVGVIRFPFETALMLLLWLGLLVRILWIGAFGERRRLPRADAASIPA